MKYLKYKQLNDAEGTEIEVGIVEISEDNAEVLNESHNNTYGDYKVLFRKASKDNLAKFKVKGEKSEVKFLEKTEDEFTVKELKAAAESFEFELTKKNKHDIFVELYEQFPDDVE